MTQITRIPFRGGDITVTSDQRIALKPVCEAIGLDPRGQQQRLERTSWATAGMTHAVAEDGKTRAMFTIDRRTFTMWLATIEASRLKNPDTRERVEIYQNEAADALDRYFHEGGAINPRVTEHQANAIIRQAQMQMELCQAAKGLIHPDHLEARARVILAHGLGEHAELDEERRPLYTQDYLKAKNLSKSKLKSVSGVFGKRVKAAYILRHGRDPQRYPLNLSNGQTREVYAYTEADRDLMDQVWSEHYETQGALA